MKDGPTFEIPGEGDEPSSSADGDLGPAFACSSCGTDLVGTFYEVNDAPFCEPCSSVVYKAFLGADSWRRIARAALFGLVAVVVGTLLYYFVVRLTGQVFALLAILVGLLVGRAVKSGSGGRGGLTYQLLAVFLTYTAIVSATLPRLLELAHRNQAQQRAMQAPNRPNNPAAPNFPGRLARRPRPPRPLPARWFRAALLAMALVGLAYLSPLLLAVGKPWMLLVIGFGLWEAWKINRKLPIRMEGPFYAEEPDEGPYSEAMATL